MQGLHRRIEPVALAQLNAQAFSEVTCTDAGRLETLDQPQGRLGLLGRNPEPGRELHQILGEISGLVEIVDQVLADRAERRIGGGEIELRLQMLAQARRLGEHVSQLRLELAVACACSLSR
jgi:hypothetical protein